MEHARTQTIREFILDQAARDPRGLARRIGEAYGISRQAANRHLDLLVAAGLIEETGQTRARVYRLKRTSALSRELRVTPVLNADRVWEDHIAPVLSSDKPGVRDLCRGAFGELVRNAVEHADASWINFSFASNARDIDVTVADDGNGIFQVLLRPLGAASPRDAAARIANLCNARAPESPVARLALLARNFQQFSIRSASFVLTFDRDEDTWTVSDDESPQKGTAVSFRMRRPSAVGSHRSGRTQSAASR
jgi:hypothetical protein